MKRSVFAVVAALASTSTLAGTCEAPVAFASHAKGSTCDGQPGIDMGGTIYAHPSEVFAFTYDGKGGKLAIAGKDREFSLTTSCSMAPLAAGAVTVPVDLAKITPALVKGTKYLLVVSSDPSLPLAKTATCGDYDLSLIAPK